MHHLCGHIVAIGNDSYTNDNQSKSNWKRNSRIDFWTWGGDKTGVGRTYVTTAVTNLLCSKQKTLFCPKHENLLCSKHDNLVSSKQNNLFCLKQENLFCSKQKNLFCPKQEKSTCHFLMNWADRPGIWSNCNQIRLNARRIIRVRQK